MKRASPESVGRIEDAAAGPIGSKAWVESKARRFIGESRPLSSFEMAELRGRLRDEVEKARRPVRTISRPIFAETALGNDGRLEPIADFDDSPAFAPLNNAPEIAARNEAERVYQAICSDECGVMVDPELMAKKRSEKAALRAQSHAIARKLELAKVPAYRDSEWTLWVYGVHSGELEEMPSFRRISFIPFIGAQIREPFIRELEFYMQSNPWARFWTLTGGKRVLLCEVRRAVRTLSKRIRKLNNQPFMKEAGVRIIFRSTELGSVERDRRRNAKGKGVDLLDEKGKIAGGLERDEKGRIWCHPHAHCLVELEKGRLAKGDWSAFLVKVRAYWKDWMDDAGVIRSAREAVKYVTKPGEIQHLSADETAALFEQLRRSKIVQPLGTLAASIKAREEAGITLIRERTNDGFVWREVRNWNAKGKACKKKLLTPARISGEDFIGPEAAALSELDMNAATKLRTTSDKADADVCVVVARCTPSAAACGLKEPRVVLMSKGRPGLARVQAHPLVERLWLSTYDQWAAGKALIRVHTGTPSVPGETRSRRHRTASPEFRAHLARLNAAACRN